MDTFSSSVPDRLLTPLALGPLRLPNRVVMSPMTRLRADSSLAPTALVGEYYAQRASAGLIISETIAVSPYGDGYPNIPGLYTTEQIVAWRRVTDAVHAAGGRMFAQLWHVGRARYDETTRPRPPGWALGDLLKPHDLSASNIATMLADFAHGARAAMAAGFDGTELHNGNGYLLDQFLRTAANRRQDTYGGSIENRIHLASELLGVLIEVWGADRVGIRLSPSATVDGAPDPQAFDTFAFLLERLRSFGLAYVHVTRTTKDDRARGSGPGIEIRHLRPYYGGRLLGAGEFTREEGEVALSEGWLDAVVYGRLFLANPDLPRRFAARAPLNTPNSDTFYTPGAVGLTDYPPMAK
jgi:N-ethylmaleimide reductase